MVKKKKEESKEKTSEKKTSKKTTAVKKDDVEKFSISELLEKNNIKALTAVGFINHYGLNDDFKEEFETGESVIKLSENEFDDMYKRYIEREI